MLTTCCTIVHIAAIRITWRGWLCSILVSYSICFNFCVYVNVIYELTFRKKIGHSLQQSYTYRLASPLSIKATFVIIWLTCIYFTLCLSWMMTSGAAARPVFWSPQWNSAYWNLLCKIWSFVQKLRFCERHGFVLQFYASFRPIPISSDLAEWWHRATAAAVCVIIIIAGSRFLWESQNVNTLFLHIL